MDALQLIKELLETEGTYCQAIKAQGFNGLVSESELRSCIYEQVQKRIKGSHVFPENNDDEDKLKVVIDTAVRLVIGVVEEINKLPAPPKETESP